MHIAIIIVIGLMAIAGGIYWLAKPFGQFSPLESYREYPIKTSEMAPIRLLKFRPGVSRRSEKVIDDTLLGQHYVGGEEIDVKLLIDECDLPPGMTIQCRIKPGLVVAIHTGHVRGKHEVEQIQNYTFGDHILYVGIPSEYAHSRNIQPSRQSRKPVVA